jgi:hypothetical protein
MGNRANLCLKNRGVRGKTAEGAKSRRGWLLCYIINRKGAEGAKDLVARSRKKRRERKEPQRVLLQRISSKSIISLSESLSQKYKHSQISAPVPPVPTPRGHLCGPPRPLRFKIGGLCAFAAAPVPLAGRFKKGGALRLCAFAVGRPTHSHCGSQPPHHKSNRKP